MNSETEWKNKCEVKNSKQDMSSTQINDEQRTDCLNFIYQCQTLVFLNFPIDGVSKFIDEINSEFQIYDSSITNRFQEVHLPPPRLI